MAKQNATKQHKISLSETLIAFSEYDFEFVCSLNLADGSMDILESKDVTIVPYLLKDGASYEDNLTNFIEYSVASETKGSVMERMSLSKIRDELSRFSYYDVVFPVNVPGSGTLFKEWRFIKAKGKDDMAIFARSDITPEVMGEYDPLTSLLTSDSFYLSLKKRIAKDPSWQCVLLAIDIDDFRSYSKVFGLQKGDEFLRFFADGLQKIASGKGLLGRLHGDNFIMALPPDKLFKKEFEDFYKSLLAYNPNYVFSVSIGVSSLISASQDIRLSYEEAYIANRSLKGTRGFSIAYFEPSMAEKAASGQTLLSSLVGAFKNDEFFICLQPIIDSRTSKVIMAEALVRWKSPARGIVYPDSFVPAMEENGMVMELDKTVRRKIY